MSWRDNWLMFLPPVWRIVPPMLLAALGGTVLIWLHEEAPGSFGANLAPLVWCALGAGLLVRPAQPLMVSAVAMGMTALALRGVWDTVTTVDGASWNVGTSVRTALWGVLPFLALPAAVGEALQTRPVLSRRLYFGAVSLFFLEQGTHRALGSSGRPAEALAFLMVSLVALFAAFVAERTLLEARSGDPLPDEPVVVTARQVRYLDEPTPARDEVPANPTTGSPMGTQFS
uniref:Transmembrane protein n=1 Tax=uncultured Armatimonadetes bacterium TaxID=157466 RepID=A0A6J4H4T1_9BACT|nr:hypothetical protein AVDCRST_MAG63-356 [uncultured Armatimonadetes bacterium]